ncbi:putative ATP/GTP-binding protein [Serinicoccus hydrothermalis]|uniref:Putative ATP/GTP-binding protein n=1 Tax=Serinicoccus hydrothermalis TaxID=1758689 RepID=A0A1B1ND14_9MICO|nr:TniB family NTP-binding protein [Serinicoccus hydrothermalis]ANS79329.1 putative ATP/GTP-binding protein [Serinicoccus hydrothermalis]
MDAHDWHRQAMATPPAWPDPVSSTDYDKMSCPSQTDYFLRLATAMNAQVLFSEPMTAAQGCLDEVVETNRLRPPGAMQMVALTAPFSAGKSTLIKQWGFRLHREVLGEQAARDRPTWSPEGGVTADWCPVVYVTLMASSSIKEVNALILLYLGYPPEGLVRTTTTRVLHALRMHGVRVVILDDANMLRSTNAQGRAVLDYIKFLNTELGERCNGTVVLVGAHLDSTTILDDPQIRARLTTMKVGAFQITTVDERAAWQKLLQTAEERPLAHLPDATPGLFVSGLAHHMWQRTQGFVGEVAKLVAGSVLDAVRDRRSIITRDHLDAVTLSERSIDGQIEGAAMENRNKQK